MIVAGGTMQPVGALRTSLNEIRLQENQVYGLLLGYIRIAASSRSIQKD